jgi:molybdopterin/thiamine biosynthesis adenylyltransferase
MNMSKISPAVSVELKQFKENSKYLKNGIPVIPIDQVRYLSQKYNLSPREIEIAALQEEIMPARYHRNYHTISFTEQIKLLCSKVAVIGCGGLGGSIIELLARMGIGSITAIDGDIFKESNLNRQLLSSEKNIGTGKAETAVSRIRDINSSIEARAYPQFIDANNISKMIQDVDLALDALDNIPARFILEDACKKLNKIFIHGAINGLQGQVSTIFPEDKGLETIYGPSERYQNHHQAAPLSVISVTPALIASLQVTEALKILLNKGKPFRNKLLLVNLEEPEFNVLEII